MHCNETLISSESFICTKCKVDLPLTNDLEEKENHLFQKFAFEPLVNFAAAYLHFNKEGIAQKLLHHLKYEGKKEIGNLIGNWFGDTLSKKIKPDIIIPVPLHKSKMRSRGYNQSEGFAEGLSESFSDSEFMPNIISRTKKTTTQTQKSKVDRWLNIENIYSTPSISLDGKNVLLVDDVVTTGATIGMLIERVKEAGVSSINVACIARG